MCQSLGCWSGSDQWVVWSKARPDIAKIIWPQVVAWARNEQYYEISLLFVGLEDAKSPEEVYEKIKFATMQASG